MHIIGIIQQHINANKDFNSRIIWDNVHLKIFPDLNTILLFNEVISAACELQVNSVFHRKRSALLHNPNTQCTTRDLHCRGPRQFFSHVKCIVSDTVPVWFHQRSSHGTRERERKREKERETHTCPGVCMSVTSKRGASRTDVSLRLSVNKSACVCFCNAKKGEVSAFK